MKAEDRDEAHDVAIEPLAVQQPLEPLLTIVEEGSADLPWLIERLANNVGFTSLSLNGANLSTDNIIAVAKALERNNTLETLDLQGNDIGPAGISAIADAIFANSTLRELRIGNQSQPAGLTAERALAKAMSANLSLIVLTLSLSDVPSRISITESLARNNTSQTRRRRSSPRTSKASKKTSIPRKPSVQPTPEEIKQIVEELTFDQKSELAEKIELLEPIHLQALFDLIREGMPDLPEEDVELDIDALDNHTLWQMLEFVNSVTGDSDDEVSDEEFEEYDDEFEEDGGDSNFGGLDVSWLVQQLKRNAGIMSLQLSDAMLTTENVVEVAKALHDNTVLECIDLEGNEIEAVGIMALAELVSVNQTLKELRIGTQSVAVGLDAEKALAKAIAGNYRMTILTINMEDANSRLILEKSLARNKTGFLPPRSRATSPEPVIPPTGPLVKRKSSIDNWSSVKNMVWKFEGGESDTAAVSERRRTKVTVIKKPGGGRVMMEEMVDAKDAVASSPNVAPAAVAGRYQLDQISASVDAGIIETSTSQVEFPVPSIEPPIPDAISEATFAVSEGSFCSDSDGMFEATTKLDVEMISVHSEPAAASPRPPLPKEAATTVSTTASKPQDKSLPMPLIPASALLATEAALETTEHDDVTVAEELARALPDNLRHDSATVLLSNKHERNAHFETLEESVEEEEAEQEAQVVTEIAELEPLLRKPPTQEPTQITEPVASYAQGWKLKYAFFSAAVLTAVFLPFSALLCFPFLLLFSVPNSNAREAIKQ
ncbi:hypothetical protein HDU98_008859 [Podochytrium sp. JEL0797]|nr:hypothetical protein HDU98_008859 [Podochytrium sp. JEL0797]